MAIIYKNTDGGRWGAGKGAPLTSMEADLNIWQIIERVTAIETNPVMPVEIDYIELIGNTLTFHMTDYSVHGPFSLPQAAFNFTGAFQPLHDYLKYDFLTAREGLYMVLHAFTSGTEFVLGSDIEGPWYQLIMPYPTVFDIGFSFPGKPGRGIETGDYENQAMFTYRARRQFYLPEDLVDTVGGLLIETTLARVYPVMKNLDQIGSIMIAAGDDACTFDFPADVQFEINDVLRVLRTDDLDDTAYDLSVTFSAKLGAIA